jgi:hypothetical protein
MVLKTDIGTDMRWDARQPDTQEEGIPTWSTCQPECKLSRGSANRLTWLEKGIQEGNSTHWVIKYDMADERLSGNGPERREKRDMGWSDRDEVEDGQAGCRCR